MYRLIKFLKEERGIGYRRISHILTDKGYRSIRTNSILKNNYIYSIYKKGKIRESRIERSFDSKIDNLNCLFKYLDCLIILVMTFENLTSQIFSTYLYFF